MLNPRTLALTLFAATAAIAAPAERLVTFYDAGVPQLAFAAAEISRSAALASPAQPLSALASAPCSPCVALASGPAASAALARQLAVAPIASTAEQSYAIRRAKLAGRDVIAVLGADARGAMYGGLDIAEALRLGTLAGLASSDHSPHIAERGIKFNLPLDARTPSYSDNADAAQANIAEMWSFDFWRDMLDEMARHRYNVLSLWNLHPFPSMVKVPEYPDIALADVKRTTVKMDDSYSHSGSDMVRPELLQHLETLRTMSIEDKIQFWRDVMQYADQRGIRVFVFTWNIFTFGAEGHYGITPAQTNPKTIDYFRASVREMVLTYPLLAGIGITAGEQMQDLKGEFSKESWLWKTYGEGVRDALAVTPGRRFQLIHRYHQSAQGEILDAFRDYPGPFDLSFKYSIAHMYSVPNPTFINELLPNLPAGHRTWLTVRNDDIYSFRWGNLDYARAYIRNIPGPDKIAGFYMGPDGYTWGREFLSTEPDQPRQPVISKQWYSFQLWGRLSYDPDLPASLFEKTLARRFPQVDAARLSAAWAEASLVFPLITRFLWNDIDLRWFPEACLSHPRYRGYFTVKDFMQGASMPGSGVLRILDWRAAVLAQQPPAGVTPLQIAAELEQHAKAALDALPGLRVAAPSKELRLTLGDIEAMAQLARYYAAKIRGAAALALFDSGAGESRRSEAVSQLETALAAWRAYSAAYTAQYVQPRLYNRVGFVDIPALTAKAQADIDIARAWQPGTLKEDRSAARPSDQPFRK